jgi:hypothetical protein
MDWIKEHWEYGRNCIENPDPPDTLSKDRRLYMHIRSALRLLIQREWNRSHATNVIDGMASAVYGLGEPSQSLLEERKLLRFGPCIKPALFKLLEGDMDIEETTRLIMNFIDDVLHRE